jgi:MoxR-like ATPase
MSNPTPADLQSLTEQVRQEGAFLRGILDEMGRTVVGQKHMLESLLIGLLADGHVLL